MKLKEKNTEANRKKALDARKNDLAFWEEVIAKQDDIGKACAIHLTGGTKKLVKNFGEDYTAANVKTHINRKIESAKRDIRNLERKLA